jgi:hypothetical protein
MIGPCGNQAALERARGAREPACPSASAGSISAFSSRRASASIVSANSSTASSAPSSPQPATYGTDSPSTRSPTARQTNERHGVHDHLGLRPAELLIADAERVGEFVK